MGGVSFHEAMLNFTLTLMGLISAFWHKIESYILLLFANICCIIAQFSTEIKEFSTL